MSKTLKQVIDLKALRRVFDEAMRQYPMTKMAQWMAWRSACSNPDKAYRCYKAITNSK